MTNDDTPNFPEKYGPVGSRDASQNRLFKPEANENRTSPACPHQTEKPPCITVTGEFSWLCLRCRTVNEYFANKCSGCEKHINCVPVAMSNPYKKKAPTQEEKELLRGP